VLATLDLFEGRDVLGAAEVLESSSRASSRSKLPFVKNVRGEEGGMVWASSWASSAEERQQVASACVLAPIAGTARAARYT
jgi:hypothetical protein